jgi:hypothetical protein
MIRANTSAAALSSSRPLPVALRTIARHAPTRVRCAPVMKIDYVKASEVGVGPGSDHCQSAAGVYGGRFRNSHHTAYPPRAQ